MAMKRLTRLLTLILTIATPMSAAGSASASAAMPAIVERAIGNMPPVTEGWAYTRETLRRDGNRIERFDPGAEPSWRLLAVDGREPTREELADYAEEIAERKERNRPGTNDFEGLAEPEGWEKLDESGERVSFRFRPRSEAFDNRAPAERLRGEMTILKNVPYVESFRLYNTEPFRVKLVARIEHIETEIRMERLGERTYLPSAVFTSVRGSALGLKGIDEQITLRYSDFRYVGEGAPEE